MNGDHDLSRAIGRIEGKLDSIHEDVRDLWAHNEKTDSRVNELEATHDKLRGGWAALSALAALIAAGVSGVISWILG